jgi:hypothetical protein
MHLRRARTVIVCLVVLLVGQSGYSQAVESCYPNVPEGMADLIGRFADQTIQSGTAASQVMPRLISFTVADALGGAAAQKVRELKAYKYWGEVVRTDKQVGASSSASGSTTAADKPGLVDLLGFAIERGAIQQSVNDTTLTLRTSLYAFAALAKGDSPATYKELGFLNRVGASATYKLSDTQNPLTNVSRRELVEWSGSFRLSGDRSTRSKAFDEHYEAMVGGLVQARVDTLSTMSTNVLSAPGFRDLLAGGRNDVVTPLTSKIGAYLASHQTDTADRRAQARAAIVEMVLCTLHTAVYEPVRNGTLRVDEAALTAALVTLGDLQQRIAQARAELKQFILDFAKQGTLSNFTYINHRVPAASDYSEFKLIFERHVKPLDVIANAAFSVYNKPNPLLHQDKLRDFVLTFSLEGSSKNHLFRGDPDLATPITYTATGRYQRLMENENMPGRQPDIANFQARIEIPITPGLSIPIAYTYASATETMAKKENRFNFGVHLDVTKVLSALRAKSGQ